MIIPESDEGSAVHILRAESPGPQVGRLVTKMKASSRILYLIYVVLTLVLILLLWISPDMNLYESIYEIPVHHEIRIPKTRWCVMRYPNNAMAQLNGQSLEEFEDFRIKHSRILSEKEFIGRLSLSIHPLDFMTMSDNDSDWSSCMSWRTCGSYRRGTVEMMNSPCVVVAYLSASKPMVLDRGSHFKWNIKKMVVS